MPEVFDTVGCRGCHNAANLGNNASANFFPRIGTDSPDILSALIAGGHTELQPMLDRMNKLPLYCLRPNSDTTDFTIAPCGTHPTELPTLAVQW